MWFGILEATLLGNMLARKGIVTAGYGNKLGKEMVRAGYGSKKNLIPPYHLTNIETQRYYQNECRYNGVYSRDNLYWILMNVVMLVLNGLLSIYFKDASAAKR